MIILRRLIYCFLLFALTVIGTSGAWSLPAMESQKLTHPTFASHQTIKAADRAFTARGPPLTAVHIITTVGPVTTTAATHALPASTFQQASLHFNPVSVAPNRGLLGNAQRQLDDFAASIRGQRNPPTTAIGAVDPQTGRIVTTTSGDVPSVIHPDLQRYADDLGGLGVRTSCGNVLGRCAEFRVANELLLGNPNLRISDIEFTQAIRPRTGRPVPRCQNCVDVFGAE